jgi:hypothetical protein
MLILMSAATAGDTTEKILHVIGAGVEVRLIRPRYKTEKSEKPILTLVQPPSSKDALSVEI